MVDHKTPVLLLICLVAILVISGCAVTKAGVDVVFEPDYLTSENNIPLVEGSLNKDLTVRLNYPRVFMYDIGNTDELKEFLNNVLKKELELVFNSVQIVDSESNYDLYVTPTIAKKYGHETPTGPDQLILSLALTSSDGVYFNRAFWEYGLFGSDGGSDGIWFSTSIEGYAHYITTHYRNFSTGLSESARVLMNQIIAFGDIKPGLWKGLAAEHAKKRAAAQAKARAAQAKARAARKAKQKAEAIKDKPKQIKKNSCRQRDWLNEVMQMHNII